MKTGLERLSKIVNTQLQALPSAREALSFALQIPDGSRNIFGSSEPAFTVILQDRHALTALSSLDQGKIAAAYLSGSIDIEGSIIDALGLRELLSDRKGFSFLWRFIQPFLFGQVKSDRKWIARHYDTDAGFFELFLDKRHRAYSQAVFASDTESLEDAETRKLDFALDSVRAKAGDHILDIGAGWGSMSEHAGKKGIKVTSLTISEASKQYVNGIIQKNNLPCEVKLEHFMKHNPGFKYDGIVNCGVTEHLPDYAGSLKQYARLLKPGGRVYLDASAQRIKHSHGSFIAQFVFEGNGSLMCLHEYLKAVAHSPFLLEGVWDDRHNYYLTCKAWAERLDANCKEIEERWGRALHRTFQLYLWGSAEGFKNGMLDAYRVVFRLPETA
jgi:cyclopropane-fatty-acyl-phospholipid synthase